jgi:Protein of unknown function (DUF5661)
MKLVNESLEEYNFPKHTNKVKGGKGDDLYAEDVDPHELQMGIEVEYEHTNDPEIACEIALDHLSELPNYYRYLIGKGIADEEKAIELFHEFYPELEIEELEIKECVVKPFFQKYIK